jgi:hypothetical protein
MGMSRAGIETLLYMMDMAFQGRTNEQWGNWHALLENLSPVRDEDWTWLPEKGERTIFSLVSDLGMCKYAYASAAFGDGSMDWDKEGTIPELAKGSSPATAIEYLQTAQEYWRGKVAELQDDAELLEDRTGPWGTRHETRWLIKTMIEHDIYHAGEINHIRALAQGNDGPGND